MSGPIVRKYGFPNFEKIFGQREVQHGADDATEAADNDARPGLSRDPRERGRSNDSQSIPEGSQGQDAW